MLLGTGYSSSLRLPFVSVFVPRVVSNLFPYFSIYCYSFLWVRLGRKVLLVFHLFPCLSPLLAPTPCLSSLSLGAWWQRILLVCHLFPCLAACLLVCSTTPPALSVLRLVALGTGLSLCPICFRARLSACSQLVLTLLSSLLLFYLGASGAQDAPCPLSVSVLVVLVVSISCPSFFLSVFLFFFLSFFFLFLSLSLLLFFFLGACWDPWFFSSAICFRTCLPCSLQVVYLSPLFSPSCILNSLPIAILLSGCFGQNASPYLSSFV